MNATEIIEKAQDEFSALSKLPVSACIGLSIIEKGWLVSLEAVERKAIPDTMDVLGVYEITVDSNGNPLCFERKRLRHRGQIEKD